MSASQINIYSLPLATQQLNNSTTQINSKNHFNRQVQDFVFSLILNLAKRHPSANLGQLARNLDHGLNLAQAVALLNDQDQQNIAKIFDDDKKAFDQLIDLSLIADVDTFAAGIINLAHHLHDTNRQALAYLLLEKLITQSDTFKIGNYQRHAATTLYALMAGHENFGEQLKYDLSHIILNQNPINILSWIAASYVGLRTQAFCLGRFSNFLPGPFAQTAAKLISLAAESAALTGGHFVANPKLMESLSLQDTSKLWAANAVLLGVVKSMGTGARQGTILLHGGAQATRYLEMMPLTNMLAKTNIIAAFKYGGDLSNVIGLNPQSDNADTTWASSVGGAINMSIGLKLANIAFGPSLAQEFGLLNFAIKKFSHPRIDFTSWFNPAFASTAGFNIRLNTDSFKLDPYRLYLKGEIGSESNNPLSDKVSELFDPAKVLAQLMPANHPAILLGDTEYLAQREAIASIARDFLKVGNLRADVTTIEYSIEQHAGWKKIWGHLSPVLEIAACAEYLAALKDLSFPTDRVPQMQEINEAINAKTGFAFVPVEGLLHPLSFLVIMAEKVFPAAQFLRYTKQEYWKYTEEPDLVHELAHAISLANKHHADVNEAFGHAAKNIMNLAKRFSDPTDQLEIAQALGSRLAALYWWGVEFFVVKDGNKIKIGGPGALSSVGEMQNILASAGQLPSDMIKDKVSFLPFDPKAMEQDTKINVTRFQDRMYVADSYEAWAKTLIDYLKDWPNGDLSTNIVTHDYETVMNRHDRVALIEEMATYAQTKDNFTARYELEMLVLLVNYNVETAATTLYHLLTGQTWPNMASLQDVSLHLNQLPNLKTAFAHLHIEILENYLTSATADPNTLPIVKAFIQLFKQFNM